MGLQKYSTSVRVGDVNVRFFTSPFKAIAKSSECKCVKDMEKNGIL